MVTDREPPALQSPIGLEGIDPASLQEIVNIDPASLQKIVAAIADAQKTLRCERSRRGVATARQRGQKLGRPCALTETQVALARSLMVNGVARKTIATTLKVSLSTLHLALKPYSAGPYPKGCSKQTPSSGRASGPQPEPARIRERRE